MQTTLEKQVMQKVRILAFFRIFFFPHARKTYALLLSILISMHYISYAAIFHNIAPFGALERAQYLLDALISTKMVTLFVLACISYFAVSLAMDVLRGFLRGEAHNMQHA